MLFQKFSPCNACFLRNWHKVWKNHLSSAPSACDFQKVYLRSIPCCNKYQVNLFLFHRFDIMLFLSSSPKVGICSNRNNLHISSFLRFVPFLWTIHKHCNKVIAAATNKYVGHTSAVYIKHCISLDFCSLLLIAKF